jgi:hypothetical protein
MRPLLSAAIAGLFALGSITPALAASQAILSPSAAAPITAVRQATIAIDPASRAISLDAATLAQLAAGTPVTVAIAGAGRFEFVVDHFRQADGLTEVGGHLRGDDRKRLAIGLQGDRATGLVATPEVTYAIGYGSDDQTLVGIAGSAWMTDVLGDRLSMRLRQAVGGEKLPPRAFPTQVNLMVLNDMKQGESTAMQLPDMGATRVTLDRLQVGATTTWQGHLTDYGPSYTVTISYSPAGMDGYLVTPEGALSLSTSDLDQPYLFNAEKAGFRSVEGECAAALPPGAALVPSASATTSTGSAVVSTATAAAGTTDQTIDVLVYYTPGMLAAYGTLDKLTTRVDQLVALANQAYTAGNLPYQLRRVGLEAINVADSNSNSTLLSQFASGQGVFSGVAARRDQVGADLVAILRPLYAQTQASCGVAYIGGANQSAMAGYSGYGYAVVSDGRDQTGQPYYCDDISFAHELGHNEGLMHDRATVQQQSGGASPLPTGAKAYAYGYAVSGQFGTIMSYTSPHVVRFSNPLDKTCNGNQVCGVSSTAANSADNVLALSYTLPFVAAYRQGTVTPVNNFYVTGVATVDGTAAAGVTFSANKAGVSCTASGANGLYTCTVPAGTASLTITPSYTPASGGTVAWQPASLAIASMTANVSQNFAATVTPVPTVYVSGTAKINGVLTAGVSFTTNLAAVTCSASDAAGTYRCAVPKGTKGLTITPQFQPPVWTVLNWSPASVTLASVTANTTKNFVGTTKAQTFNLTGIVTVNGVATAGVGFTTNNAKVTCSASTKTGAYSCTIPAGTADLTITPKYQPAGGTMAWSPASVTLASVTSAATQNFAGTFTPGNYRLEIKVTLNKVLTTGVPINITYSGAVTQPTCSVNGSTSYVCQVSGGTKMTIAPAQILGLPRITYSPASKAVTVTADTVVAFTAKQ